MLKGLVEESVGLILIRAPDVEHEGLGNICRACCRIDLSLGEREQTHDCIVRQLQGVVMDGSFGIWNSSAKQIGLEDGRPVVELECNAVRDLIAKREESETGFVACIVGDFEVVDFRELIRRQNVGRQAEVCMTSSNCIGDSRDIGRVLLLRGGVQGLHLVD